MSDPDITDPVVSSGRTDLNTICEELQWQLHTLRIALLVIASILCAFFWREVRFSGRMVDGMRAQATQVTQFKMALEKQGQSIEKQEQAMKEFLGRLSEYGRTHSDFVPILTKYGIPTAASAAPAVPAATTPAAPKK